MILTEIQKNDIAARYPGVFLDAGRRSIGAWAVAAGIAAYLVFAWWFFSIGAVFANARWEIAGAYLADWVSYESRPNVRFQGDSLRVSFPRFDPMGRNPDPDWLERTSSASGEVVRAVVDMSGAGRIDIAPGRVTVTRGGETLVADIVADERVDASGALPEWAAQRAPGQKVIVDFGFSGRAEIEDDEVKIRHRFLGWANFLFDPDSPFWNRSAVEVLSLVWSGERIDPQRSNLSLAWNNILYNAEWQHLDVWTKLLQTIVMAFVGTVLATLVAFPLAFLAARNITRSVVVNQLSKRFFDFLRSVDMLIWALFFTRAFGPGPLAGISAIFFTDTGTFGKLYSEALENIDDRQREGVKSVGASPAAVQRFGVLPQVLPVFLAQSLYFWESNTRSATIIGAVGAGGIGLKLWEAMRTNSDWENVAYMVLLILAVVFVFDGISSYLRQRLIAPEASAKSS
ncbi:MAG: phosphonate ABC transporter, permease protein PhnE [Rhizobiaceae bacterium]|nr:phosphonate ABC transporter, permease protein PhnE [Rhizobiaceae bacterium]